ncbi:MAG: PAS domain-containing sensor histidine kinase [Phycisphaerales bacterium]|nr:PAS domain-containing sensor histidine kinase [Phycisphaerales bacterium]NNM25804.1 PAS domain-containing sensor histidine kinase [Phycisphaerales bacterium]
MGNLDQTRDRPALRPPAGGDGADADDTPGLRSQPRPSPRHSPPTSADRRKRHLTNELGEARRLIARLEEMLVRQVSASTRSEERFNRLFDSNVIGVIVCDVHGAITEANPAFLEMLGYSHADLPLRWDRMTPLEWRRCDEAKVAEVMSTGAAQSWEKEYIARDGHRVRVRVAVALLSDAGGECLAIVEDVSEARRAEQLIVRQRMQLRALTAELGLAEERERRRIAAGLHDDIGQTLALAKLGLARLRDRSRSSDVARVATEVDETLEDAIRRIRSLTFELGAPVLYQVGLAAALEALGEKMMHAHGIRFQFQSGPRLPDVDNRVIVLYRIVRELLTNLVKHANAGKATITVDATATAIEITVADDGTGFDTTDAGRDFGPDGGFGLFSVREQVRHLGGHLHIVSAPGAGSRIAVTVPIRSSAEPAR